MSDGSVTATRHFADTTLRALLAMVLRSGVSSCGDGASLRKLSQADSALAAWCQRQATATDQAGQAAVRTDAIRWDILAGQLPQHLLRDAAWQPTDFAHDAAHPAQLLLSGANLVVRLHALETSFARDLESQHTQSLYNFAYGLSHELNNPLANIATRAGVLLQESDSPATRQLLTAIIDNAMRGCEMLGDLMLIARPPVLELKPHSPAEVIQRLLDKATPIAEDQQITLAVYMAPELPSTIPLDEAAITEAIWCLLRNAFEALPSGGKVDFSLSQAGKYVHLQINDNGQGLSQAALQNCFDPYYSAREAGRGLGVGLAKARRLIELHSGNISVANRAGGGGSVIVLLPI